MLQTHTFYIDKHINTVSLDGEWQFCFEDSSTETPDFKYTATIPASSYRNLTEAGLLPDPYFGCNSKLYNWVDKKTWYFRKKFVLEDTSDNDVYLCFDGVGYGCRVFLNGTLLCEHEGMFGGPICEISEHVKVGENTLIVEVTPPAPDYKLSAFHDERALTQIVPWNIRRDNSSSNGDFIVFGIWRSVRLEILSKYHLSRPYLYTETITYPDGSVSTNAPSFGENYSVNATSGTAYEIAESAKLHLFVELADPQINEFEVVANEPTNEWSVYNCAYCNGLNAVPTGKKVDVSVKLISKTTGETAFEEQTTVDILNKEDVCSFTKYRECQFFELPITVKNPRLWQPNNVGKSELYTVILSLIDGDKTVDTISFDTGIRTIEYIRTAGMKHRSRWDNYHFVVNGRPMFVKGINWMPADFLFDISDEDYRWTLEMVKNLGVQVIRVWSGGGMPEDDRFYALCDKFGILVIQDNFIANQLTERWNKQVLQSQVCQNLYRIRNHPSLAVHTGGNEINPYAEDNDASMWIIRREIEDLDPIRRFWNTSPDKGSAHIYRDIEPTRYRKDYGQLPFIGESGIHSFPNAKSLRQQISEDEFSRPLSNIFSEEFSQKNPELRNHFTEFNPERIPRMMARASMINNIAGISLPDLCEATQLASCEFYQIMIQSIRDNYPYTCGIIPWVFKRGWTTVAIQLVDGLGDPIAPYYYVKNAYSPLCAEIALDEVSYAPEETFTPKLSLICDGSKPYNGLTVSYEIYSPELKLIKKEDFTTDISTEQYKTYFDTSAFTVPKEWSEKFFFIRSVAKDKNEIIHQSFYWCKVLERLSDKETLEKWRDKSHENVLFDKGPWLKPQISNTEKAKVSVKILSKTVSDGRISLRVRVSANKSPLFPVKLDIDEDKTLVYAFDNYFFIGEKESREIEIEVRLKADFENITLRITSWNGDDVVEKISVK